MHANGAVGDAVRVGRFEWERLMLMSVPHPTNFKLLPLGVFMSADGGRVRPGNAGLAMFGPHEKTWAKLLRWAVDEGWLVLVERGGARRGAGGTTVKRASVYAAAVPRDVWERRSGVLGAPPFRSAGVEGSGSGASGSLKGAPGGSVPGADLLKGAPAAPFNGSDDSMKGAPGDSLPESMKGAVDVHEGSDSGFEGSTWTLPHHVVPSCSSSSSTSSSAAQSTSVGPTPGDEGGGGGDSSSEDQAAEALVAALDYRGKAPKPSQLATIRRLAAAALAAGWTEQELKECLDLKGDPNVRDAAALYGHRLKPDELPDLQAFREASRRPLEGTDAVVDGWMALSRQLGGDEREHAPAGHRPAVGRRGYSGPARPTAAWDRIAEDAANGVSPPGAEKYKHCGTCDPVTRMREGDDWTGERKSNPCARCHPSMQFS